VGGFGKKKLGGKKDPFKAGEKKWPAQKYKELMSSRRCKAITAKGTRCKNSTTSPLTEYCYRHINDARVIKQKAIRGATAQKISEKVEGRNERVKEILRLGTLADRDSLFRETLRVKQILGKLKFGISSEDADRGVSVDSLKNDLRKAAQLYERVGTDLQETLRAIKLGRFTDEFGKTDVSRIRAALLLTSSRLAEPLLSTLKESRELGYL
jgi:hypothetical protein